MDGFNEKKWFVYMGDHHEGPFSLADIQGKMAQGLVTASSYVWCDGMPDWKVMSEVPECAALAAPASRLTVAEAVPTAGPADAGPSEPSFSETVAPMLVEVTNTGIIAPGEATPTLTSVKADLSLNEDVREFQKKAQVEEALHGGGKKRKVSKGFIVTTSSVLVIGGAAAAFTMGYLDPIVKPAMPILKDSLASVSEAMQPQIVKLVEKFPALGQWISPIRQIQDIAPEEYEELKAAAGTKLEPNSIRAAFGLAKADLATPTFYVATNLPDGAQFEVYVEGVSDTLLNQTSFSGRAQALVTRRLGQSSPVRFADGKPVPAGQYMVYVVESSNQPEAVATILANAQMEAPAVPASAPAQLPRGRKLLSSRSYFMGGVRDANYNARLKEYHDRLMAKATAELKEVKEFAAALESQLAGSVKRFSELHKGNKITPAQRKAWNTFHQQWFSFQAKLTESFSKWSAASLETEYFYGMLYRLTQQAGAAIERAHGFHQQYFAGSVPPRGFDIQIGEATSQAQTAMTALKAKIDQAEKIPPTLNGMPRKDGL